MDIILLFCLHYSFVYIALLFNEVITNLKLLMVICKTNIRTCLTFVMLTLLTILNRKKLTIMDTVTILMTVITLTQMKKIQGSGGITSENLTDVMISCVALLPIRFKPFGREDVKQNNLLIN